MFKKHDSQKLEMTLAIVLLLLVNFIVTSSPRGWVSWSVAAPALMVIAITAIARLRDITERGFRWFVRRIAMILVGTSALGLLAAPLLKYESMFPAWSTVCLYWGFALAWITTPNMPPWWDYINRDKEEDNGKLDSN